MERLVRIFTVLFILFNVSPADAAWDISDRSGSPYFFVDGDAEVDRFPLQSTVVSVDIAGVIAQVQVTQSYRNEGTRPLEAKYVFPASSRAAVSGLQMRIGDRLITARIKEKEEARRDYEEAKAEGRTASLLEQVSGNVFQMSVANILPGETVAVTLRYSELLVPEDGIYEYVYPTAMGPRYTSGKESKESATQPQGVWGVPGTEATGSFDLAVRVAAGLPIVGIESPSHRIVATPIDPTEFDVQLAPGQGARNDRDFILRYGLRGGAVQTGMMLGRTAEEQFFLLMLQPPARVAPESVPPREYIFIVDVSGSMDGFPIETGKYLMRQMLTSLRSVDRFNLLLFANGNAIYQPSSVPATPATIQAAMAMMDRDDRPSGGTEILPAMRTALALPREGRMSRTVVLITDGLVTASAELYDTVRGNLGTANLFVFGPGGSVNRNLLEATARIGAGEPFVVTDEDEARQAADRFQRYIESPVLTEIQIEFKDFQVESVEPMPVPDLFAQRPLVVVGKYRGPAKGTVNLRGRRAGEDWSQSIDIAKLKPVRESGIPTLWARRRIQTLSDYESTGAGRKKEITALGLKYGLATAYTSFIAVDEIVRAAPGAGDTVQQPAPMPRDYGRRGAYGFATAPQRLPSLGMDAAGTQESCSSAAPARGQPGLREVRIARGSEAFELLLAGLPERAYCLDSDGEYRFVLGGLLLIIVDHEVPTLEPEVREELERMLREAMR